MESIFDQFYTPDSFTRCWRKRNLNPSQTLRTSKRTTFCSPEIFEGRNQKSLCSRRCGIKEVETKSESIKLVLEGTAKGDRIAELRLYQNGKLVGNNNRNLLVEDDVAENSNSKELVVTLY